MATYSDPTIMTPTISTKKGIQSGAILACVAGLLSIFMAGYLYWQSQSYINQQETLTSDVKQLTADRDNLTPVKDKLTYYDTSAKGLHVLYDNQKQWQKILDKLEEKLFSNMALTTFSFDEKGKFTFSGYTTDYVQYAKIYSSFTDPAVSKYFTKVRPTAVGSADSQTGAKKETGMPPGAITFSFEVTLSDSIMKPTEEKDEETEQTGENTETSGDQEENPSIQ